MISHSKLLPLSYSSLKQFSVSPAHFLSYKNAQRKDSAAMLQGRLIHKLILEQDLFLEDFAVFNGRKAGKEWTEFKQNNITKDIVKASELDMALDVKNSISNHKKASRLINDLQATEKYFKAEIEGLEFHGFIDGVGKDYLLDLKTTVSSDPHKFSRDSWNMKYHLQAAIYCHVTGVNNYYIIAVEKSSPFAVSVFKLDEDLLEYAKSELSKLITDFKEWNGENKAYDHKIALDYFTMYLPEWLK